MPLIIERNDITKIKCDAIVNAANKTLLGGGGVDGAIHAAAGSELLKECQALGGCKTGETKITGAYNLPCKYVIHTVGPIWHGGNNNEEALLRSCYRSSLALAKIYKFNDIAFPIISAGAYGYPKAEAFDIAVQEITKFLYENDMTVRLVVFEQGMLSIGAKLFGDIKEYISANYAEAHYGPKILGARSTEVFCTEEAVCLCNSESELEEVLRNRLDESFSQMLLRKIDEKGMSDSACYKKANVDRRLFSKIRSDVNYRPSKATALAFAIALELNEEETAELLRKAGYALSHSSKFDIIIEFFIKKKIYDVLKINEALFAFDQNLLGA